MNGCTASTKVGIGTATPVTALNLGSTSGTAAGGITFGTGTNLYRSASDVLKTDDALIVVKDLTFQGHLITGGSAPTAAPDTSAGTGATCTVNGNDSSGYITLTTGTGSVTGKQCTVTFATAFGATPHPVITPTSATGPAVQPYVGANTTTFHVDFAAAPADATVYTFNYFNAQ